MLTPSPVATAAADLGVPIVKADRLGDDIRRSAGQITTALFHLPASAVPFAPLQASGIAGDEAWLLHRPGGLFATAFDAEYSARSLRAAASAYATTDATIALSLRRAAPG